MPTDQLVALTKADFDRYISKRPGEKKVGEVLKNNSCEKNTDNQNRFSTAYQNGVRYAVLLIPEDIGPRANLGRAGAAEAPEAFLSSFLNMQSNRFFDYTKIMIAGNVNLDDLQERSIEASIDELRRLVEEVDLRVEDAVVKIVRAGLKPIVIGGGNNNSLPTIRGVIKAKEIRGGINVVNCDPHADYRKTEGRHSGNPFSYANNEHLLASYCVFGLHESYNSEDMLTRLKADGFRYYSFEESFVRGAQSFQDQLILCKRLLKRNSKPLGVEVDLESIKNMPASALTPVGITEEQAVQFIHQMTREFETLYLHLSEGAPCTANDGSRTVGKFMALAVNTYLKIDK